MNTVSKKEKKFVASLEQTPDANGHANKNGHFSVRSDANGPPLEMP
jgi:hypothetical protein